MKSFGNGVDYIVSEKDAGVYDAWNKGIKKADGNWIMFIGADDVLASNSLEKYLDYLSSNDTVGVDIISAKSKVVDRKGRVVRILGNPYKWEEFRSYMKISHGSTLHNRLLFNEIGYFDTSYKINADYEFLLRKKLKALFIDEFTLAMQEGGMSVSYKSMKETFKIRRKYRYNPYIADVYIFVRGCIALFVRKNIIYPLKSC